EHTLSQMPAADRRRLLQSGVSIPRSPASRREKFSDFKVGLVRLTARNVWQAEIKKPSLATG
ncbi:MAG TPA: hypothetical protein VNA19_17235, partial [Pyrinomonadaceae bacterium]|nr:hypothetical protein [Pyrinomonadaceae bacterium]